MILVVFYSTPPDNLSIQEFQSNEAMDVEASGPTTKSFTVFCLAPIITLVSSSFCFLSLFFRLSSLSAQRFYPLPILSLKTLLARLWQCSIRDPSTPSPHLLQARLHIKSSYLCKIYFESECTEYCHVTHS